MYEIGFSAIRFSMSSRRAIGRSSSRTKDLANAPADPLKLLGDLPKNYDLAVRLSVKNVPDSLRQMLLGRLQSASDRCNRPAKATAISAA